MKIHRIKRDLWFDTDQMDHWYQKQVFKTTKIVFNDNSSFIWLHWQYGVKATKSLFSLKLTGGIVKIWRFEFQYQNYYLCRLILRLRKKFNYWK